MGVCDEWGGAESRGNGARPVELTIMSDTCATHRSRVPRRSSGRIKGGATTVEDERGPGLDFNLCFVCGSRPWGAAALLLSLFICLLNFFKCSPVPASFFPIYELCYNQLYTLFIIIRGFASRASRTLDWTRTRVLRFLVDSDSLKLLWLATVVIEINRYVSDLLQCTTLQKQSANTNTYIFLTWGGCRLLSFCCLCLFSCVFSESWTWLHTYVFLKSSWWPIFSVSGGSRPRVWKPLI